MSKILVIEDDSFLGDVLTSKLTKEGYDVHLEHDGAEGLKQIGEQKPDLVLLDIVLPTMNGYEILEAKQKDAAITKIPVIIISNSGQVVEINRALALGVNDYLVKAQLDPAEVVAKVHEQLGDGPGAESSETKKGVLAGKSILLVEDDSFLREVLSTKLIAEGCAAHSAKDGEEALEKLKAEHPDIILLDLVLPGISGFDVLEQVKKDDATKDIPVIVLSNLGQDSDQQRVKELGAAKHLVKASLDPSQITHEIADTLGVT